MVSFQVRNKVVTAASLDPWVDFLLQLAATLVEISVIVGQNADANGVTRPEEPPANRGMPALIVFTGGPTLAHRARGLVDLGSACYSGAYHDDHRARIAADNRVRQWRRVHLKCHAALGKRCWHQLALHRAGQADGYMKLFNGRMSDELLNREPFHRS